LRGRAGGGRPASHARAVLGSLEELPQPSAAIGEGFLDVTRHSEVVGNGSDLWVRQQGDILRREGEMPAEQIQSIEKALLGMVRHIGLEGNTDEGFFGYGRAACLAWGDPPDEVNVEFVDGAFGDLRQTWYEQFFASDPRPELRRLRVPLVALFAGADQQVTVDLNLPPFVTSLIESGNDDFTVTVLPDEDHFFMTGDGLAPNEHVHGQMKLSPAALERVSNWLQDRLVSP